jgi:tetratricopeptide (TPR) repeat protein
MAGAVIPGSFEALKAATCLIDCGGKKGTGYLVSANRIVTCHHVVDGAREGQAAIVTFCDRQPTRARVTDKIDTESDAAVLEWLEPFGDIAPLRFGRVTRRKVTWDGYGFPRLAAGQGLPIDGTIDDLDGKDTRGKAAFVLTAGKFEAGTGAPAYGYSGSPVTFNGLVIGHLKRIVEDPDYKGHVAFGTVYAARVEDFLALLPGKTFDSIDPLAPSPSSVPAPADGYDVTLSASARDLPKAAKLVEALEMRGKRVFFPIRDVRPGQSFADTIETALSKSSAAVVLVGRSWDESLDTERNLLWAWHESVPRPLVPVLIDKASEELPAHWSNLRPLDLREKDLAGPAFERLIYAIEGKAAPYDVVAADIATKLDSADDLQVTIANARRLIAVGNPRKALGILPADATDVNARGARALALAKCGRIDEAIAILEGIKAEGKLDAETGGILGGRYREKGERGKRRAYLELALDVYRNVFEKTGNPYPGINTASLLLQLGYAAEASEVASRVLITAGDIQPDRADHWTYATLGEASVIRGDFTRARQEYGRAVRHGLELIQDIAVIRRGARRVLRALGRDEHELDDIFSVPRPVAFVGHGIDLEGQQQPRFPRESVGEVRRAIKGALDRLDARLGIASATVGGDTLFIEELLEREGSARVLLPCPQGPFLDYFVVQPDRKYEVRNIFNHERAEVIVVNEPADPTDLWSDFGPRLRDHAREWGRQLDESPVLLALRDGRPSFLASVIDLWREQSLDVEILYLRDGHVTTAGEPSRSTSG